MRVAIIGPNLRDQTKGSFHVHEAGCRDRRNYGPGGVLGGEDNGWVIDAESRADVTLAVYGPDAGSFDLDEDDPEQVAAWGEDFHFAPCCASLK